jgi:hypothetical protein
MCFYHVVVKVFAKTREERSASKANYDRRLRHTLCVERERVRSDQSLVSLYGELRTLRWQPSCDTSQLGGKRAATRIGRCSTVAHPP